MNCKNTAINITSLLITYDRHIEAINFLPMVTQAASKTVVDGFSEWTIHMHIQNCRPIQLKHKLRVSGLVKLGNPRADK